MKSEAIENCGKSVGILSNETIVAQHPWTTDVELELERIREGKGRSNGTGAGLHRRFWECSERRS